MLKKSKDTEEKDLCRTFDCCVSRSLYLSNWKPKFFVGSRLSKILRRYRILSFLFTATDEISSIIAHSNKFFITLYFYTIVLIFFTQTQELNIKCFYQTAQACSLDAILNFQNRHRHLKLLCHPKNLRILPIFAVPSEIQKTSTISE